MPGRGVIHHLLLSLLRPSKKKRKTRRTTREKKKDLHALALGGKKLTKSFSKRRRSGVYLHRRRRRRLPLCEVRTLSLSLSLASPRNPKNPPQRGQSLLRFFRGISSTSLRRSCFRSLLAGWDLPGRGGTAVTSCDKGERRQTTATHDDEEQGGGRSKGSKRNAWHPTTCARLSTRGCTPSAEGGRASLLHLPLLVYRCFPPPSSSSFRYFLYFLAILSSSRSCKISQIAVPEIAGRESGAQEGGA